MPSYYDMGKRKWINGDPSEMLKMQGQVYSGQLKSNQITQGQYDTIKKRFMNPYYYKGIDPSVAWESGVTNTNAGQEWLGAVHDADPSGQLLKDLETDSYRTNTPFSQLLPTHQDPKARALMNDSRVQNFLGLMPNRVSSQDTRAADQPNWWHKNATNVAPIIASIVAPGAGLLAGTLAGSAVSAIGGGFKPAISDLPKNFLASFASRSLSNKGSNFSTKTNSIDENSLLNVPRSSANLPGQMGPYLPSNTNNILSGFVGKGQVLGNASNANNIAGGKMSIFSNLFKNFTGGASNNSIQTALGLYSLYKAGNSKTPSIEDSVTPLYRQQVDPALTDITSQMQNRLSQIKDINPQGLTDAEKEAMFNEFKVNLSDISSKNREMAQDDLSRRGMRSSSVADKTYNDLAENDAKATTSFQNNLTLLDAKLKRSDVARKDALESSALAQLLNVEQIQNAQRQAQYKNEYQNYLMDYNSAINKQKGYADFATNYLTNLFMTEV